MVLQGIQTNIAKKPYIFVIFEGGGGSGPPVPRSGSAHGDDDCKAWTGWTISQLMQIHEHCVRPEFFY